MSESKKMNRGECFRVLGLSEDAPEEEVRKAYKKLALRTHPDKNPNDPEAGKRFLQISEAYKRIVDPDSFKDEDEEGDMNEEEMAAMFNAMLFEMFGGGGMDFNGESNGMHHMPAEFFEMMMMGEGFDDDSDDELGVGSGMSVLEAAMMMRGGGRFGDFCGDAEDDEDEGDEAAVFAKLMGLMQGVAGGGPRAPQFSGKSKSGKKKKQSGRSKGGNSLPGSKKGVEVGDEEEWETDSEEEEVERKRNTRGNHGEFEFSGELGLEQMLMAAAMGGAGGRGMDMSSLSQMMAMMGMDGEDDYDNDFMMGGGPAPSKRNSNSKTASPSSVALGDRVLVHGKHIGVCKFIGNVAYAGGVYVGVEMEDLSVGKNSGFVKGIRYFQCSDGRGLMVKETEVRKIKL